MDNIQVGGMSDDQVRKKFILILFDENLNYRLDGDCPALHSVWTLRRPYPSRPLPLTLQRYVGGDFFLFNQDCTYVLVHTSPRMLLTSPILSVSAEAMEEQMVQELVFLGYRPFLVLRVVD